MFEKADAEYAELSQKKQILYMDKDKIEKVGMDATDSQRSCSDSASAGMPSPLLAGLPFATMHSVALLYHSHLSK